MTVAEQQLKELAWALNQLGEKLPDLYTTRQGNFQTKVGGLRVSVPIDDLARFPHDIVVRSLAQEAEMHGQYFDAHQGSAGWTVEYSKQQDLFVDHSFLLVAMVLARLGEAYIPEDLS